MNESHRMATIEQFRQLQLKVARVLEARAHPNADKLLVLRIDTGESQKEIVAGIARHYRPEELVNKQIVVVDNLEPAMIRGVLSNGMLLAAQDGEHLTLVVPEKSVASGSQVQ